MAQNECIVYLEAFEKVDDGIIDAYIDFRQIKDMVLFGRATGYENNQATLIELRSLKYSKRLRQGCYYKLNLKLLNNYQIEKQENSLLIGASYNLSNMPQPKGNDSEVLQTHGLLNPMEMSEANIPRGKLFDIETHNNLNLFVKDVGQANWNELRSGDIVKIVYDAGAELKASIIEVRNTINSRKKNLQQSKPALVISHWDMDHIHCLKGMSINDISDCFSKIICPDKLKSVTSTRVLYNFRTALGSANVYCLPLPAKTTHGKTMHLWKREDCITLYQAEASSQINYCGLVMFVRGENKSANYTGDCKLTQAKNVYDQEIANGLTTKEHVLIAPHHGGDCGASNRIYTRPCDLIEISVGNNSYGHPQADMLKYMQRMGYVKQTRHVGDIIENL